MLDYRTDSVYPGTSINFKNLDILRNNLNGDIKTQSNFTNYHFTATKQKHSLTKTMYIKDMNQKDIFKRKMKKHSNTVTENITLNLPSSIKVEDKSLGGLSLEGLNRNRSVKKLLSEMNTNSKRSSGTKIIDLEQYNSIKSNLDNMRRSKYVGTTYKTTLDNECLIYFRNNPNSNLVSKDNTSDSVYRTGRTAKKENLFKEIENKEKFYRSYDRFFKPESRGHERHSLKTRLPNINEVNEMKKKNYANNEKYKNLRLRNVKKDIAVGIYEVDVLNDKIVMLLDDLGNDVANKIEAMKRLAYDEIVNL
jgi:hypothetical protein